MENEFNILIADDDSTVYSASIKPFVRDLPQAKIYSADTPEKCRRYMGERAFQFILLDISFGPNDSSGLKLLPELRQAQPNSKIFMLSTHDDQLTMLKCMQAGATDFISKRDINLAHIAKVIRGYIESEGQTQRDESTGLALAERVNARFVSISMKRAFAMAALAQRSPSTPVLINGETGVGKDVIARAITSTGTSRPVVSVDCGAIPESLAESELFGHKKGAFTGAISDKEGLLKGANGGTVFLDEIGELPKSLQAKLLRVLQEREVTPVGDTKSFKIDIRLIAATNRDLEAEVTTGQFRQDLYYRINVVQIRMPPLREHPADIPELVKFFIEKYVKEFQKKPLRISNEALRALMEYAWPGNVRELENVVERSVILGPAGGAIDVEHLPVNLQTLSGLKQDSSVKSVLNLDVATANFARKHILKVLESAQGDKKEAARLLGLSLSSLYRKMEDFSIPTKNSPESSSPRL